MATKKKATKKPAKKREYVIVRCTQGGVHAGYLEKQTRDHVFLVGARRIWYWSGAASLSEIAVYGLNPEKSSASKIAAKVRRVQLRQSDCCEILACEPEGQHSIEGVATWRA